VGAGYEAVMPLFADGMEPFRSHRFFSLAAGANTNLLFAFLVQGAEADLAADRD